MSDDDIDKLKDYLKEIKETQENLNERVEKLENKIEDSKESDIPPWQQKSRSSSNSKRKGKKNEKDVWSGESLTSKGSDISISLILGFLGE